MAIPVPTNGCPLAAMSVHVLAYRSCPLSFVDSFVGTLDSSNSLLTLRLWSLAVGPCLASRFENLVMRFSSRALSSGTA